jgi:biotin carboxyl carrier protein
MKFELYDGGKKLEVEVTIVGENLDVSFEGKRHSVRLSRAASGDAIAAVVDGKEMNVVLDDETETALRLTVAGRPITLGRARAQLQAGLTSPSGPAPTAVEQSALASPLFGKVISVDVKAGDTVDSGQSLVVLEAMKMESVLRADGKHTVKEVLVKEGDGVNKGQLLMRFG